MYFSTANLLVNPAQQWGMGIPCYNNINSDMKLVQPLYKNTIYHKAQYWCVGQIGEMLENEAKLVVYVWKYIGGDERKFLVIGLNHQPHSLAGPTFQHLRISTSDEEGYHAMIWKTLGFVKNKKKSWPGLDGGR